MIARLSGTVVEFEPKGVILDVQGVGYRVLTTSAVQGQLPLGGTAVLRIHHHVTDQEETLFGFIEQADLTYFHLLLTVPSVGPRTAMNVLELAPPHILERAVAEDDITVLTKVSGVGKKTAQRIMMELKGKITKTKSSPVVAATSIQHEAVEALMGLGMSAMQARSAVGRIPADVGTVEEAVRAALQRHAK